MHSFRLRYIVLGLLIYIQSAFCRTCGSDFNDLTSRAIRADVIFQGTAVTFTSYKPSPSTDRRQRNLADDDDGQLYYVTFRVRVRNGKLLKGSLPWPDRRARRSRLVTVGVFGPLLDKKRCISPITKGSNYIVFLRVTNSSTSLSSAHNSRSNSSVASGRSEPLSYTVSSFPEPMSKHAARKVRRSICANCAKKAQAKLVPKRDTVLIGKRLRLRCKTQGRPIARVTWFKDNLPLVKSPRHHIRNTKRGSVLKIKRANSKDSGIYQCQAENVVGGGVSESIITVRAAVPDSESPKHAVLCEDQSYCLNGGTCYTLKDIRTKFCKCTNRFTGPRCENKQLFEVLRNLELRNARMFDRSLTLWGLIVGGLVFIAILIIAYFLSRHKRKQFRKKKALKEQQQQQQRQQQERFTNAMLLEAPIVCQTANEMNAMPRLSCLNKATQTPVFLSTGLSSANGCLPRQNTAPASLSPPPGFTPPGRGRLSGVSCTPIVDRCTTSAVIESDCSHSDSHGCPDDTLANGFGGSETDSIPDKLADEEMADDGMADEIGPVDTRSDMDVNVDTTDDCDTPGLSSADMDQQSDSVSSGGEEEQLLFQRLQAHPRVPLSANGGHCDEVDAPPNDSWQDFPQLPDLGAWRPLLYDPDPDATPV